MEERNLSELYTLAIKKQTSLILEAFNYGNDEFVLGEVLEFWEKIPEYADALENIKMKSKEELDEIYEQIIYTPGSILNTMITIDANDEKEITEYFKEFLEIKGNNLSRFKTFTSKVFDVYTKYNEKYPDQSAEEAVTSMLVFLKSI